MTAVAYARSRVAIGRVRTECRSSPTQEEEMFARDVMTTRVVAVSPDLAVSDVAALLLKERISAVPVIDAEKRVLGIVSEGDLMRRPETEAEPTHSWWLRLFETPEELAADYAKTHGLRAKDVMTRHPVTVSEDMPVGEIARLLEERRFKRVPVVREGRLVGIVSRANLLQAIASRPPLGTEASMIDDRGLREKVLEEFDRLFVGRTELINLTVADGMVHLWGIAKSSEEKQAMRVAAENVAGPGRVIDHIGVLPANMRALIWAE